MNTMLETRSGASSAGPPHRPAGRGCLDDLIDDLCSREVPGQTGLACGAERAVHAATGLGRNAHGHALAVPHEHGLDHGAVEQAVDGLDRHALVRLEVLDRGQQRRHGGCHEFLALAGRQVGHLLRIRLESFEVVLGQLRRAESRVAGILQHLLTPGQIQVGQVLRGLTAAGGLEDQLTGFRSLGDLYVGGHVRSFRSCVPRVRFRMRLSGRDVRPGVRVRMRRRLQR